MIACNCTLGSLSVDHRVLIPINQIRSGLFTRMNYSINLFVMTKELMRLRDIRRIQELLGSKDQNMLIYIIRRRIISWTIDITLACCNGHGFSCGGQGRSSLPRRLYTLAAIDLFQKCRKIPQLSQVDYRRGRPDH